MRQDYLKIKTLYTSIFPILEDIAKKLETQLTETLIDTPHIDRVICRPKSIESFMTKASTTKSDGSLKYAVPMREIQDMVGARIVVYYKNDIEFIRTIISGLYGTIENVSIVPDDVTKFGYEGFHMICFIPNNIFSSRENPAVSNFFELQIKTLFQHAWSQSNHGLGYKPGTQISLESQRMLAFIAAQSWSADKALMELVKENLSESPDSEAP